MRNWFFLAALGATTVPLVALTGCVPAVMAPTVSRDTRAGKAACRLRRRSDRVRRHKPISKWPRRYRQPTTRLTGTALQNVLTGTGDNAVAVNTQATATLQQQYDTAYSACMYAKGDNVPPYYMQPTYYAEPTETTPTHHGKRRVAQKPSSPKPATTASTPARLPVRALSFRRQLQRPPPARVLSNPHQCNQRVRTAASRCHRRHRIEGLRLCLPGSSGARNINGAERVGAGALPGYRDTVNPEAESCIGASAADSDGGEHAQLVSTVRRRRGNTGFTQNSSERTAPDGYSQR